MEALILTPRGWARVLAIAVWAAICVWVFAFSFSDSYFSYNLCSRVPVFGASLVGALALPIGAVVLWGLTRSVVALAAGQAGVVLASLVPLAATSFVLARIPGPCHLSGDDAMGAGIDFLLLAGAGAVSVGVVAAAAAVRKARS